MPRGKPFDDKLSLIMYRFEGAAWSKAAKKAGCRSLADWVRRTCNEAVGNRALSREEKKLPPRETGGRGAGTRLEE